MNTPKSFYRELDELLASIDKNKSGKNFLPSLMTELEENFGQDLKIYDGCIYEQRDRDFIQTFSTGKNEWIKKVTIESPNIKKVLEHGTFIFDSSNEDSRCILSENNPDMVPAAMSVNSPEGNWLIVFGLREGWIREEITLFLNAMRTALNYRLFSDIIKSELQQTVQIQKSLLPKKSPQFSGFEIYGRSVPAELVGGDFFEYFEFEEGTLGVSVGDASGHGLPAALLVRDVVIGLRMGLAGEYKIVHTMKKLNKVIQQSTYSSNFVSVFIAEIERNGHLFYVNAGHPAPYLVMGDKVTELGPTGLVLGFLKEIDLQRSHIYMDPGSVLALYSDGLFERQDSNEMQFGEENLKQLLIENQHLSSKEIVNTIFKTAFEFGNNQNWEDDVTLVIIKRI
ncbi:MAG: serine/threonine-protein phosphatase [Calditrichaceae bacterium]|nr:serine/threonine-protein phosphatase [Calditrichaceae bacterium]HES59869.1 serine/threonine-protein phosphatase [Caldithrix sp.]